VSLQDIDGVQYWLPMAVAFRRNIKLSLDVHRIADQLRHRSILGTDLVPDISPEPAVDRPLVDSALQRLAKVIPALAAVPAERYWAGLVDMTPDGLPVIDSDASSDGLTVITGLCGHGFTLGPVLGEIAADLAIDGRTNRPIETFALARYLRGVVRRPAMTI
jgi:glycine/D-amino acid oxidase-like deaminating enzyme